VLGLKEVQRLGGLGGNVSQGRHEASGAGDTGHRGLCYDRICEDLSLGIASPEIKVAVGESSLGLHLLELVALPTIEPDSLTGWSEDGMVRHSDSFQFGS